MKAQFPSGAFPTMITPFRPDQSVDFEAAERLTEWYAAAGCHGVFAVCQSSELYQLNLKESAELVRRVKAAAEAHRRPDGSRMAVVASGCIALTAEEQAEQAAAIFEAGAEAVVLLTNRMDFAHRGDAAWIADTERLLALLPEEMPLGLYECPTPYKRLLSGEMLRWCAASGRFSFIKDTCCSAPAIGERMQTLKGSGMQLYNANAQTLLPSLRMGAAGYCGIMANFHPKLYVWLCEHYEAEPEKAEKLAALLSLASFTESLHYPVTAKYHLSELEGLGFSLETRVRPASECGEYDALVMRQMKLIADEAERLLGLKKRGCPAKGRPRFVKWPDACCGRRRGRGRRPRGSGCKNG